MNPRILWGSDGAPSPTVSPGRAEGIDVTKSWMKWTLASLAFAAAATAGFACDQHAKAADAKDGPKAAAAGCDMPCCAHAKDAVEVKTAAAAAEAKPCAAHDPKGCPKKAVAVAVANAGADKEPSTVEPTTDSGTQR